MVVLSPNESHIPVRLPYKNPLHTVTPAACLDLAYWYSYRQASISAQPAHKPQGKSIYRNEFTMLLVYLDTYTQAIINCVIFKLLS